MNIRKRRKWIAGIALLPLVLIVVCARPAQAQFGLDIGVMVAYLKEILSTVGKQTQPILATQNAVSDQLNFLQKTMYPVDQMNAIWRQASQYDQVMANGEAMFGSPINSATLPQTSAFERVILGGNPNNISSIGENYQTVYGALPAQKTVSNTVYTVLDANDAQAQAALKKSVQLDAIAQQEEKLSMQYMQQLRSAAPGTAQLITAQAAAWNLQASAYTQEGMAQLLRAESAETSFKNFEVKNSISAHSSAVQSFGIPSN